MLSVSTSYGILFNDDIREPIVGTPHVLLYRHNITRTLIYLFFLSFNISINLFLPLFTNDNYIKDRNY
jgi:hypothetical protein